MATPMNVIRVPQPVAGSFNKNRPVSKLLQAQLRHLAEVLRKDMDDEIKAIKTEGEASAFIRKITAILHPQGAKDRVK
jgi:hypothetical protein